MRIFMNELSETMDKEARHVFVGHAFVTSAGEAEENTSDAERPLSIGGAEYVNSHYFDKFHYTALDIYIKRISYVMRQFDIQVRHLPILFLKKNIKRILYCGTERAR